MNGKVLLFRCNLFATDENPLTCARHADPLLQFGQNDEKLLSQHTGGNSLSLGTTKFGNSRLKLPCGSKMEVRRQY